MLKRIIALFVVVSCIFFIQDTTLGFSHSVSKVEAAANTTYYTTADLNLRKGPSTNYKAITTIPKGKAVTFISKSGKWYKVKYGTKTGYASSSYLSTKKVATTKSNVKGYKVPILMYHAIDQYKGSGLKELYVTPKNFEAQMKYLKSAGFTPITFDDMPNISKFKKPILITFDDGYKNNRNAYNVLKKLNDSKWKAKGTIFMIGTKIDGKNGLTTSQMKEMSNSGIISFQSHTMTHPFLTATSNYKKELGDIKTKIEKITGKKVTAIAYPSGRYNSKVLAETKKYYKYAVTTQPGIANTGSNHYELKRVRVSYSTSLNSFKKSIQ